MICKNCGIEVIVEGSKFCNNCGAKIIPVSEGGRAVPGYFISTESKKGKKPTCGRIGLWMMIGSFIVEFFIGVIIAIKKIPKEITSYLIAPLFYVIFLASVILAITSLARGERKAYGIVTLSIVGAVYVIGAIVAAVIKL